MNPDLDPDDPEFAEKLRAEWREQNIAHAAVEDTFRAAGWLAIIIALFEALLGSVWAWAFLAYLVAHGACRWQMGHGEERVVRLYWPFLIPLLIALYAFGHPYVGMSGLRDGGW